MGIFSSWAGSKSRGGGSGTKGGSSKKKHQALEFNSGGLSEVQTSNIMNSDADKQLYEYKKPRQQRGMTDLIATHQSGNDFQFVAVTGNDKEEFSTRVQRLLRLQPSVSRKEIPSSKPRTISLVKDIEKFCLHEAIPAKGQPFIYLSRATAIFVPLTSFLDGYSEVKFSLIDTRLINNQERQSVTSGTNLETPLEFSMDHCIPRSSASRIQFCVSRTSPNLVMGEQWGVVTIMLELEESDHPFVENTREVAAAVHVPSSGLEEFARDPTHLNIQLHENHRTKLQDLYSDGAILDTTQPKHMRLGKPTYSKSSAPAKSSMKKQIEPISNAAPDVGNWDLVKSSTKPDIPDDQLSFSVPDEDEDVEEIDMNQVERSGSNSPESIPGMPSQVRKGLLKELNKRMSEESMKAIFKSDKQVRKAFHGESGSESGSELMRPPTPLMSDKKKGKKVLGFDLSGL